MPVFQINNHLLQKECDSLAAEIVAEFRDKLAEDETLEDYRDEMSDRAHEDADGHEWVIYHYKSLLLCACCSVDWGEEFLEESGMLETPTLNKLASLVAYGEMRARIDAAISEIIENEPATK